jgi:hypothetical protein
MSDSKIEKLLGLYQSYVDEFDYKEICRIWIDYDEVMDDIILNVFFSKRMAIDYGGRLTAISNRIIDEIGKKFFSFMGIKPKLYIHFEYCNKLNETKNKKMKKVIRLNESQFIKFLKEIIDDVEIDNFDYENEDNFGDDIEDLGFDYEEEDEYDDESQKELMFRDFMRKNKTSSVGIGSGVRWEKSDDKPYNPIKPSDMPLEKYLKMKKLEK